MMNLGSIPRIKLGISDTPLDAMPRLSKSLGGPTLYIKRDDCTGLALGGNKTRKLEFLMADALARGADTIITAGATQSNHARQTAAAAAKLGLKCIIVLAHRAGIQSNSYLNSGNVLLDRLLGAAVYICGAGTSVDAAMQEIAEQVRSDGGGPYIVPVGGSNSVGSLGYVACAAEILEQAGATQLRIDHVVHATGSAGTQAGLIAGFAAHNSNVQVLGISVRDAKAAQEAKVLELARATAALFDVKTEIRLDQVVVNSDYVGEGYGIATVSMIEAVSKAAQLEGLILDPVYTGKGLAGLIDLASKGHFKPDENVVFVHTGGSPGLFGFLETFEPTLAPYLRCTEPGATND